MSADNIETIYKQAAKLKKKDKLSLISRLVLDLQRSKSIHKHQLSELQGLGKEIWNTIDPEKYVQHLRGEWHDR